MLRDPAVYPEPDRFLPSRWLTADGALREDMPAPTEAFGFGRRICPGRHFAHDFLWVAIAQILAMFRIERALDEHGEPIATGVHFTPRFIM